MFTRSLNDREKRFLLNYIWGTKKAHALGKIKQLPNRNESNNIIYMKLFPTFASVNVHKLIRKEFQTRRQALTESEIRQFILRRERKQKSI